MEKRQIFSARRIAYFAFFTALVVVLQVWGGSFLRIGTVSLNCTLIPVALCGMLLGVFWGTLLGFVVGLITLIMVVTGLDPWSAILFANKPFFTSLLCILKSTAAGFVSSGIFYLSSKAYDGKPPLFSSVLSSIMAPIVNTLVFILGMLCMLGVLNLMPVDEVGTTVAQAGMDKFYYLFVVVIGVNFFVELALNLFISPALYKVVRVVDKSFLDK